MVHPVVHKQVELLKEQRQLLDMMDYLVFRLRSNTQCLPKPLEDEHKRERRKGEEITRERIATVGDFADVIAGGDYGRGRGSEDLC